MSRNRPRELHNPGVEKLARAQGALEPLIDPEPTEASLVRPGLGVGGSEAPSERAGSLDVACRSWLGALLQTLSRPEDPIHWHGEGTALLPEWLAGFEPFAIEGIVRSRRLERGRRWSGRRTPRLRTPVPSGPW